MQWFRRPISIAAFVAGLIAVSVSVAACQLPYISRPWRQGERLVLPPRAAEPGVTRLAVIGDYGMNNDDEAEVAALIASWEPDAVITTGDNNYPDGTAETIDDNIGRYFHDLIAPYRGVYGPGASVNRFFPVLGNHDWRTASGSPPLPQPYLDFFTLPGNERYYDVQLGPVHVFAVDSDSHEPDGIESTSIQADWLRAGLRNSTAPWRLVFTHHPPYSSSSVHGSTPALQWPFAEWGASAVLSGHDHAYERIERDGMVYFVNGIGGASLYPVGAPVEGSQVRFNAAHGAMLIEATQSVITYTLAASNGDVYDTYVQYADSVPQPVANSLSAIEVRVRGSDNDAEESLPTGVVNLTSTDLELISDTGTGASQVVGMRFDGVPVPPSMTIRRAYIEFTVDEATDQSTSVAFVAEASDRPAPFQSAPGDLSQRARTAARVAWLNVPAWPADGRTWRTPDLTPIVQEIVDRPTWQVGLPMLFLVDGVGRRTAESFDGSPESAPLLHIEVVLDQVLFLPLVQSPG